jgi:hypothetical protein
MLEQAAKTFLARDLSLGKGENRWRLVGCGVQRSIAQPLMANSIRGCRRE